MSNNMPNKDTTNNQSNFILEMTSGQVSSFNATFSSRSALDGDHLLHKQEGPNDLSQNLLSLHHLSPKKTFNVSRWPLAQVLRPSNLRLSSKQNRPQLGHPIQLTVTPPHHQNPTQALPQMKTIMYLRYIHPFLLSTRSLILSTLLLRSAQIR